MDVRIEYWMEFWILWVFIKPNWSGNVSRLVDFDDEEIEWGFEEWSRGYDCWRIVIVDWISKDWSELIQEADSGCSIII